MGIANILFWAAVVGLVARKKLKAYSAVATGFLVFSTLVVMFSIRTLLII